MNLKTLIKLFNRDIKSLEKEIGSYNDEMNLWLTPKGINNSAGNLALHIVGNLNHYIGSVLGQNGYVRKRDLEFSQKDIPRIEILKNIDQARLMVEDVLSRLKTEDLVKEYPLKVFGEPMSSEYFLTHLTTHLSYHLGQINYHRRLLDA